MNLAKLFTRHQAALINMQDDASPEARLWAGECADFYGRHIVAARDKLGVPVSDFVSGSRFPARHTSGNTVRQR